MDDHPAQLDLNMADVRRKPFKLKISNPMKQRLKPQISKTMKHPTKTKISKPMKLGGGQQHICPYCTKGFGSGKALGGHIRIHALKNPRHKKISKKRDLVSGDEDVDLELKDEDGKVSCCVCKKDFRSLKSLFGHMRNHPDRGWRGIRPPASEKNSCGSSTISENEDEDEEEASEDEQFSYENDDVEQLSCETEKNSGSDLLNSFSRWTNTSKRCGSDDVFEAARTLIMLGQDKTKVELNQAEEADETIEKDNCFNQFYEDDDDEEEEGNRQSQTPDFYPKNQLLVFEAQLNETLHSKTQIAPPTVNQTADSSEVCFPKRDFDLNEPYVFTDSEATGT